MMLRDVQEIECCCPFCCLGNIEPGKLALFSVCFDMFILFCMFVYFLYMQAYITIGPLVLTFGYILFLFVVLWDLKDPAGKFHVVKYYSYFRAFTGLCMTLFTLTNFILIFVFYARPSLALSRYNMNWALIFFIFFGISSVIQWGTVIGLYRALKYLTCTIMNDLNGVSRSKISGPHGMLMATPQARFKV